MEPGKILDYCSFVHYIFCSLDNFISLVQCDHPESRVTCGLGMEATMYVHVVAVPDASTPYACLLFLVPVSAGYPSPADDYLDGSLDLNQHLIKHPTATLAICAQPPQ